MGASSSYSEDFNFFDQDVDYSPDSYFKVRELENDFDLPEDLMFDLD